MIAQVTQEQHTAMMVDVKERDLTVPMPQDHEDRIEQLHVFDQPVNEVCMLQFWKKLLLKDGICHAEALHKEESGVQAHDATGHVVD